MNATVAKLKNGPVEGPRKGVGSYYDPVLVACVFCLLGLGLVILTSASMTVAERANAAPLSFLWRQLAAVGVGGALALITMRIPLKFWYHMSSAFLFLGIVLLLLVIVPGIGKGVNGSMRWLKLGPITVQASELTKLCMIIYMSGYLLRHGQQVRTAFLGFIKPIGVLTIYGGLLLLEPDYGATVVLFATGLGMMFMAGVPLIRFIAWGLVALFSLAAMAVLASYRMERIVSFIDPWADPLGKGFQLIQALVAFGRGEWFGVGLGNSVQKLFYLPEVHTDFIFAVVAEELGLIGTVTVIGLFTFLVWRALYIARQAEIAGQLFSAYLAYGVGLLLGLQAFFNIGVSMGVLPTKGLTLPFISYGSNNIVVTCIAIGLLLRVGFEAQRINVRPTRSHDAT